MRHLRPLALALALAAGAAAQAPDYRPPASEQPFLDLLDKEHRPLEAREAANAYLATHPDSFAACLVIGLVDLHEEGDLPRAHYYLRRARELMERGYRRPWENGAPWRFYATTLMNLYSANMEMDRYADAIEALNAREAHFWPKEPGNYGWPLMKLGRIPEARLKIAEALQEADPGARMSALNTLGAIEGESDHPDQAYAVTEQLYALCHGGGARVDCTYIRNHAEHAQRLGRIPEAERLYLESSRFFSPYSFSNPWQDLALLYLEQQRFPEALDATKRMQSWAFRSRPLVGLSNWNYRQTITAALLLYCGSTDEALGIAKHLVELPDRHGSGSTQADVWEAGSQLFYHQVLQDALARDDEELSFAPWRKKPALWARRAGHAFAAASAGRRAARLLMAQSERLSQTLRVMTPNDVSMVPGGETLLPQVVGSGVVEAETLRLLQRKGAAADRERGLLLLFLGAARVARQDWRGAVAALDWAERVLPAERALERTQLLALRAKALDELGERSSALRDLVGIMGRDAGAVRRFGLRLPCAIAAGGGAAAQKAAAMLQASPRLEPGRQGFRAVVEAGPSGGLQGGLDGPSGEVLCRFQVPPQKDPEELARTFCRLFHQRAFGPHIDLSQQQINSLTGSTLAAEGMQEQLKGLLGGEAPAATP